MLYLHIGVQKTGTTFLQQEVFPKWRGINYFRRDSLEKIIRRDKNSINLLSREGLSGQNWGHKEQRIYAIRELASLFPEARVIISFRQHSAYIVSSYKQYIQRGGYLSFEEYFDPINDAGLMKIADFACDYKVEAIKIYFRHFPFIFLYEELGDGLAGLLGDLEAFMGGQAPAVKDIKRSRHNASVGSKPLKLLRKFNRYSQSELNPNGRYPLYHWRLVKYGLDPRSICQYRLSWLPSKPLLGPDEIKAIDHLYKQDWQTILELVENRNHIAGKPSPEKPPVAAGRATA